MLPPSVNNYVRHLSAEIHVKSKIAKGWENSFTIFSRGQFFVSESGRFKVTLEYWPGPGDKGDVDNYNKLPLDCCAKAGMFRNAKGEEVTDAWVKKLVVEIHDTKEERQQGPKTRITIEGI